MPTPDPNTLYDKALAQMDENRKEMEKEHLKTMMEQTKGTRDLFLRRESHDRYRQTIRSHGGKEQRVHTSLPCTL